MKNSSVTLSPLINSSAKTSNIRNTSNNKFAAYTRPIPGQSMRGGMAYRGRGGLLPKTYKAPIAVPIEEMEEVDEDLNALLSTINTAEASNKSTKSSSEEGTPPKSTEDSSNDASPDKLKNIKTYSAATAKNSSIDNPDQKIAPSSSQGKTLDPQSATNSSPVTHSAPVQDTSDSNQESSNTFKEISQNLLDQTLKEAKELTETQVVTGEMQTTEVPQVSPTISNGFTDQLPSKAVPQESPSPQASAVTIPSPNGGNIYQNSPSNYPNSAQNSPLTQQQFNGVEHQQPQSQFPNVSSDQFTPTENASLVATPQQQPQPQPYLSQPTHYNSPDQFYQGSPSALPTQHPQYIDSSSLRHSPAHSPSLTASTTATSDNTKQQQHSFTSRRTPDLPFVGPMTLPPHYSTPTAPYQSSSPLGLPPMPLTTVMSHDLLIPGHHYTMPPPAHLPMTGASALPALAHMMQPSNIDPTTFLNPR